MSYDDEQEFELDTDEGLALPDQTRDDTDEGWSEAEQRSRDADILADRPPHWD